jgi:hypothetical protein
LLKDGVYVVEVEEDKLRGVQVVIEVVEDELVGDHDIGEGIRNTGFNQPGSIEEFNPV